MPRAIFFGIGNINVPAPDQGQARCLSCKEVFFHSDAAEQHAETTGHCHFKIEQLPMPPHPLVEQGYLSIDCAPCTNKVKPGEDPRSGRWAGWDKTECGIHTPLKDGDPDLPVF